jgi:hypothetical protein
MSRKALEVDHISLSGEYEGRVPILRALRDMD